MYNCNDQVKDDEMRRTCSTKEENKHVYGILVGDSERKRLLGRPRCRKGLLNMVEYLRVPKEVFEKTLEFMHN
jgi:hypothetical protein